MSDVPAPPASASKRVPRHRRPPPGPALDPVPASPTAPVPEPTVVPAPPEFVAKKERAVDPRQPGSGTVGDPYPDGVTTPPEIPADDRVTRLEGAVDQLLTEQREMMRILTAIVQRPDPVFSQEPVVADPSLAPSAPLNIGLQHAAPLTGPTISPAVSTGVVAPPNPVARPPEVPRPTDPPDDSPWWWPVLDQPVLFDTTGLTATGDAVLVRAGEIPARTVRRTAPYPDQPETIVEHPGQYAVRMVDNMTVGPNVLEALDARRQSGDLPLFFRARITGLGISAARQVVPVVGPTGWNTVHVPGTILNPGALPTPTVAPSDQGEYAVVTWPRGQLPSWRGTPLRDGIAVDVQPPAAEGPAWQGVIIVRGEERNILGVAPSGETGLIKASYRIRVLGDLSGALGIRSPALQKRAGWNPRSQYLGPARLWDWAARGWYEGLFGWVGPIATFYRNGSGSEPVVLPDGQIFTIDVLGGTSLDGGHRVDVTRAVPVNRP